MTLQTKLQQLLDGGIASDTAPGLIAVIFNRSTILAEAAAGVRSVETQEPINTSTTIWQASKSKAVISFAVLRAVEQRGFDVHSHDQLVKVLPEFDIGSGNPVSKIFTERREDGQYGTRDAEKGVTLAHLLTHTAGFGYNFTHEATQSIYEPVGPTPSNQTGSLISLEVPRVFEAGEGWLYGHSAAWVGIFLERLTGLHLRQALQDLVFTPLSIEPHTLDTFVTDEMKENRSAMHVRGPDGEFVAIDVDGVNWAERPPEGYHVHGDAPLHGSILAYTKFAQTLLNGGAPTPGAAPLISEKLWKEATSDALAPMGLSVSRPVLSSLSDFMSLNMDVFSKPEDATAGEGWTLLQTVYNRGKSRTGRRSGTLSWAGLANSYFFVDVEAGIGGIIAAQILPWANPGVYALRDEMEKLIYENKQEWE